MVIIYGTHWIWYIRPERPNIEFLTSASSFGEMTIGNMNISHQMEMSPLYITFRITLELKPNGKLQVCDFRMDFGDENDAQSSIPERNDQQRKPAAHRKGLF
eukprot:541429_1